MVHHYDRQGNPMTMMEWASSFDKVNRQVKETTVSHYSRKWLLFRTGWSAYVSTVWLGLDHRFGNGPPLIFESMVFGGPYDQYQERYSTEEEALAGHIRIVEALQKGKSP